MVESALALPSTATWRSTAGALESSCLLPGPCFSSMDVSLGIADQLHFSTDSFGPHKLRSNRRLPAAPVPNYLNSFYLVISSLAPSHHSLPSLLRHPHGRQEHFMNQNPYVPHASNLKALHQLAALHVRPPPRPRTSREKLASSPPKNPIFYRAFSLIFIGGKKCAQSAPRLRVKNPAKTPRVRDRRTRILSKTNPKPGVFGSAASSGARRPA
jgi:hypothetical protein